MPDKLTEYELREKRRFDGASPEDQLRIANAANDQLFQLTSMKLGTLPVISGIAAALLVVASFNKELLPLTFTVKILISALMLMVPISLILYVRMISKVENIGLRLMNKVYGVDFNRGADSLDKATYQLPWVISFVILGIILVIIAIIWFPTSSSSAVGTTQTSQPSTVPAQNIFEGKG